VLDQAVIKGKTILVVEDEEDLREPIAMELESLGATVLQAANGVKAFEILQKQKVDAVISDIRMPGGDGVALLKNIKTQDHTFPVVMLITGFSDLSREDAYHLGAEFILSKPFDLDDIVEAVSRILTPKAVLWNQPDALKGSLGPQLNRDFFNYSEAKAAGEFALGRGGFYLRMDQDYPNLNANTRFLVRFQTGDIAHLEGVGKVRWLRKTEAPGEAKGVGIEFEALVEQSREKLFAILDQTVIRPFIPKKTSED
jgi:CheY-like chemotaxis protein